MANTGTESGEFSLNVQAEVVMPSKLTALDMARMVAEREQLRDRLAQLSTAIEAHPDLLGQLFELGIDLLPETAKKSLDRRLGGNPYLSDEQLRRMAELVTQHYRDFSI